MTDFYRHDPEFRSQPAPGAQQARTDADALRRHIAQLVEENGRLAEAVAARDALLFVAGHELRNPITPILGRLQMLRRLAGKPGFAIERVESIVEQIEWLIAQYMKRAGTLLDVSRITSGRLVMETAPVDVSGVVRQVLETFRPVADHAGCELQADLPEGTLLIAGDALALEEIIDNLVSNAIKFGRGKPIVVWARVDPTECQVDLRVCDQGRGISAADQARVFERFERAVRLGEPKSGFGVGLWIVRQLAEAMGGSIKISSDPGAGSAFCVSFPVQSSGDGA